MPSVLVVEQGPEDARGVETGTAEPIDCAVGTDEGRRLQIADQAVLTNGGVAIDGSVLSRRSDFLFAVIVHFAPHH